MEVKNEVEQFEIMKRFIVNADTLLTEKLRTKNKDTPTSRLQRLLTYALGQQIRQTQNDKYYKTWVSYVQNIIGVDLFTQIANNKAETIEGKTLKYILDNGGYMNVISIPHKDEDNNLLIKPINVAFMKRKMNEEIIKAKPNVLEEELKKAKDEANALVPEAPELSTESESITQLQKLLDEVNKKIQDYEEVLNEANEEVAALTTFDVKEMAKDEEELRNFYLTRQSIEQEINEIKERADKSMKDYEHKKDLAERLLRRRGKQLNKAKERAEQANNGITNIGEFFEQFAYSDEQLFKMYEQLINGEAVDFSHLSNYARADFLEYLKQATTEIMSKNNNPDSVIYVKFKQTGDKHNSWHTRKLTPEEFENFINSTFIDNDGFIIPEVIEETIIRSLSEGDNVITPQAYTFDTFQIITANGAHAVGSAFSSYYYIGTDDKIANQLKRYQIPNHIPTDQDKDLMIPCAIHTLLLGAADKLTPIEYQKFKQLLYSRCLTRWISRASLKRICCEYQFEINEFDLNGNFICKLSRFGDCEKEFGETRKLKQPRFIINVVIWKDHMFLLENLKDGLTSAAFVRELLENGELKPLNKLQCNIYSTRLWNRYHQQHLAYNIDTLKYEKTAFKEPEIIENDNTNIPSLGLNLFIKYLIDNNMNVLTVSSYPKHFIRRTIKGGEVRILKPMITDKPVVVIDANSAYPSALAEIDIPIGYPSIIGESETLPNDGIYFIEADITYTPQHELDYLFPAGESHQFINSYDTQLKGLKVNHIYKGYWFKALTNQPLKPFIEKLYNERSTNPNIKLILNSMYGKMYQKPTQYIHAKSKKSSLNNVSSHPLIHSIEEKEGYIDIERFNDIDYRYNYVHIASLILSKLKLKMHDLYNYCHNERITMLYTSTDSLTVYEEDLPKLQHLIKQGLGNFKIEARGEKAIFIKEGFYYINDNKYCSPHHNLNDFKPYA